MAPLIPEAFAGRATAQDRHADSDERHSLFTTHGTRRAKLVFDKVRRRFRCLELIWADGGHNAWQVEAAMAKVPRRRTEIVERSDDIKGVVTAGRSSRLALRRLSNSLVRQPASRQPTITKVGKPDYEGSFARASGNDEVAPEPAVPPTGYQPSGPSVCSHSTPGAW